MGDLVLALVSADVERMMDWTEIVAAVVGVILFLMAWSLVVRSKGGGEMTCPCPYKRPIRPIDIGEMQARLREDYTRQVRQQEEAAYRVFQVAFDLKDDGHAEHES